MANPRARHQLTSGISQSHPAMIDAVEETIDELVSERPLKPVFIVPGTTPASAALDHARAITRRAERHVIRAIRADRLVSAEVVTFLNPASDLVYVLARHAVGDADEIASHD